MKKEYTIHLNVGKNSEYSTRLSFSRDMVHSLEHFISANKLWEDISYWSMGIEQSVGTVSIECSAKTIKEIAKSSVVLSYEEKQKPKEPKRRPVPKTKAKPSLKNKPRL